MFDRFIPKEFNFFDLFEKQVGFAVDASRFFKQVISSGEINESALQKIRDIEHQGDDAAHTIEICYEWILGWSLCFSCFFFDGVWLFFVAC